jgi:hypothetical protein
MHLSLPVPDSRQVSRVPLQRCLDSFVQQEVMEKTDAWYARLPSRSISVNPIIKELSQLQDSTKGDQSFDTLSSTPYTTYSPQALLLQRPFHGED